MDIRQPTEREMIEGIALGFKEFLLSRNKKFGSDLSDHKILEVIKISVRHAAESIASQKNA